MVFGIYNLKGGWSWSKWVGFAIDLKLRPLSPILVPYKAIQLLMGLRSTHLWCLSRRCIDVKDEVCHASLLFVWNPSQMTMQSEAPACVVLQFQLNQSGGSSWEFWLKAECLFGCTCISTPPPPCYTICLQLGTWKACLAVHVWRFTVVKQSAL